MTTRRASREPTAADDSDASDEDTGHRGTVDQSDAPAPAPADFVFEADSTPRRRAVIAVFMAVLVAQVCIEGTEYDEHAPSEYLKLVSTNASSFFTETGKLFVVFGNAIARIISFHSVAIAIFRLLAPLLETVFWSPLKVISGAFNEYVVDVDLGVRGITTGAFVLLFLIVVAQRTFPDIISPKAALVYLRKGLVIIYGLTGTLLTDLFSVLYVLKLDKAMETLFELAVPAFAILRVPWNSIKAVFVYVWDLRSHRFASLVGFIIVGGLFVYGGIWYGLDQWDMRSVYDVSKAMGAIGRLSLVHVVAIGVTFCPWFYMVQYLPTMINSNDITAGHKTTVAMLFSFNTIVLASLVATAARLALGIDVTGK
jgi:hypothetical protein